MRRLSLLIVLPLLWMNTLTAKRLYDHKFYVIEVRAGDVIDESLDDAVDEIDDGVDEKAEESI